MSRARLIIALLIVLIVPPSVHIGPFFGIVHEAQAATTSIKLYAFYYGWNLTKPSRANPTITVTQGDTISFNLINNDTIAHLFLLDFDANGAMADCPGPGPDKCSGNISPAGGTGSVVPFTFRDHGWEIHRSVAARLHHYGQPNHDTTTKHGGCRDLNYHRGSYLWILRHRNPLGISVFGS